MKKLFTILFSVVALQAMSQQNLVPNAGFELHNSDGTVSYWGKSYSFNVWIDTGDVHIHTDSIVIDQAFYAPTTDAHSGNWAIEMRNAYNFTTGVGTAGGIKSIPDSIFQGYHSPNSLNPNEKPTSLNFYYKYFPAGDDWAYAHMSVQDSAGNVIGEAVFSVSGQVDTYTYVSTPIDYYMEGTAAYYSLEFSTAAPCGQITLGTRFLVDDISFSANAGINEVPQSAFELFPNPTNGLVTVKTDKQIQVNIYNVAGKLMQTTQNKTVDISTYPSGIYYFKISPKDSSPNTVRIIKN